MNCKSCKGTKKIQLLHSFVDCMDCAPASKNERFERRSAALEKAIDDVQTRRQDSIARGLAELNSWYQNVMPRMVELEGEFHKDAFEWLFGKDRVHRKLDETDAEFRTKLGSWLNRTTFEHGILAAYSLP